MSERIATFSEFWRYYLRQHSRPQTRALHYFGTALALPAFAAGVALADWRLGAGALALGYGPAWAAHALIERNRPATFTYPLWSLAGDLRMLSMWATGRLAVELERAGVGRGPPVAPGST